MTLSFFALASIFFVNASLFASMPSTLGASFSFNFSAALSASASVARFSLAAATAFLSSAMPD